MSVDYAIWESEEPLEDDEAGAIYHSLMETGSSDRAKPSPKITQLAEEINSQWPDPGPGREDEWPFASPVEVSDSHVVICVVPSRDSDVTPIVARRARELELVWYDPQQQGVFLPRRLSQKRTRLRAKRKKLQEPR